MTNKELVANAVAYLQVTTCYEKGFWCQYMSQAEYDRILKMYPGNNKYGNEKYINTGVFAADCICWIKQLLGGGTVTRRLSYQQMSANPLGDCDNRKFYNILYDCCEPSQALPGYGLATTGHAALYVGNGQWMDFNYSDSQNGAALHTGFSGTSFKCGKIPGISYENDEPIVDTERAILERFTDWLIDLYLKSK